MHLNPEIRTLLEGFMNPSLPGIDLSLERMLRLLDALGNPHLRLPPVIHIAGTNGKGSLLAYLREIYRAAGYRVHAYSSPHLVRFNERITLAGQEISDEQLLPLLEQVALAAKHVPVTFFEATTVAAFLSFAEHGGDVVLLETGLGGRLDATNVIAIPAATVITPIGLDHVEFLGGDIESIAAEKAGIMKPGVPCIVGEQTPDVQRVLARRALALRAPLVVAGHGWSFRPTDAGMDVMYDGYLWQLPKPALLGEHQWHNAALASVVAKQLVLPPVTDEAVAEGIRNARWPGRLQQLRMGPLVEAWGGRGEVVLDGAHNGHAAAALLRWIAAQQTPVTLLCGLMRRKDARAFLKPFAAQVSQFVAVPIAGEECYTPDELAGFAQQVGIARTHAASSLDDAADWLAQHGEGMLVVAGSLFLAGEVLKNHR